VLTPSFPATLARRVRRMPDVARAVGGVESDQTHLVGRDGKSISSHGAPNLGFSADPAHDKGLNPLVLVQGRWPSSPDELVIDVATAHHKHYAAGHSIAISVRGPRKHFRIAGLAD